MNIYPLEILKSASNLMELNYGTALSGAEGWEDIEDFGHLKLD